MDGIHATPELIIAAAAELDTAADRLAAVLSGATPETHVLPSGSDAVSMTIAGRLNEAATSHQPAAWQGVAQLHHAAATLRGQAAAFAAGDAVHAVAFDAVAGIVGA